MNAYHQQQYLERRVFSVRALDPGDKLITDADLPKIEAKMKEQAIFKLYSKYPFLNCKTQNNLEKEPTV